MTRLLSCVVVAIALVLMGFGCVMSHFDFLVFAMGVVLRPVDVSVLVWSLSVLVSFVLVGAVVFRHRPGRSLGGVPGAFTGMFLVVALVLTGAWCLGGLVMADGSALLGTDRYTVVQPPEGDGCTVIAHEQTALRESSGVVYTVPFGGIARRAGSWTADEIQLPIHDGTYSLSWEGPRGQLALRGERAVTPERFALECGN